MEKFDLNKFEIKRGMRCSECGALFIHKTPQGVVPYEHRHPAVCFSCWDKLPATELKIRSKKETLK